jgi:transposase
MKEERQEENKSPSASVLVGLDLHSEKVQLCVTLWTHGSDPVKAKSIVTTLASLENTYRRQIPKGALTVMEATTNAFAVARRLAAIGHEAKVLPSDIATGMSTPDRINDAIDAYNIAVAYAARGRARGEVFVPSEEYQEYRAAWFAYRNADEDVGRFRNRLWHACSEKELDGLARKTTPKTFREGLEKLAAAGHPQPLLEILLSDWEHALAKKEALLTHMKGVVARNPAMRAAMSVLGVAATTAFAVVAFVEDARRFPSAKKLCSYLALNPTVCESNDKGPKRKVSKRGRGDLKRLLVEGAQSGYRYGTQGMHKWARRKVASGKDRNLVMVALARKMAVALWHALMGHPVPGLEAEPAHVRKLAVAARGLSAEELSALGHENAKRFADAVARDFYAHLRVPGPEKAVPVERAKEKQGKSKTIKKAS